MPPTVALVSRWHSWMRTFNSKFPDGSWPHWYSFFQIVSFVLHSLLMEFIIHSYRRLEFWAFRVWVEMYDSSYQQTCSNVMVPYPVKRLVWISSGSGIIMMEVSHPKLVARSSNNSKNAISPCASPSYFVVSNSLEDYPCQCWIGGWSSMFVRYVCRK